ncbi:MAG: SUF system FeS assembly protein, NifU family [Microgenomates group bacterium GW2011_GWF2_46_18]|nr:MAG: SUF system FeS assembly protein, NifU family [Microgenomates group bacterium GW2011_GWF2_46_18]
MDLYREDVLDHYEHPRNQGELTGEGVESARDSNASCGDMVQFYLKIKKGRIEEVKWKGIGCAITTAAASKLSEYLRGRTLQEIRKMSEEDLLSKGIGFTVNPGRMKCLMLPVAVVRKVLDR